MSNLKPDVDSGFWVFGGARLDEPPSESGLKANGSVMVAVAESKEEVLDKIKKDVYATSGVWDMDQVRISLGRSLRNQANCTTTQVQIFPFKSAIRKPL